VIAALLGAALAVLAVPPSPPVAATVDEPAPWRLRMSVGAGLGLGLREPLVPRGPVSTSIPPSVAARVSVVPWIERTAGRGLAIHVPLSYASTIGARIFDEGPGLARTRRIRSHRLEAATDVLMALGAPGPHRWWLGVGALGSYTMLDDIVPGSLPSYGFGLLGVRAPVVAALARGAVVLGVAPAIGITVGDARARAVDVGLGLGLAAAAWARIRITRRLGIAVDYSGYHGRWPGSSGTQRDRSDMLTAGLVLTA
jgi:hypothetical protein